MRGVLSLEGALASYWVLAAISTGVVRDAKLVGVDRDKIDVRLKVGSLLKWLGRNEDALAYYQTEILFFPTSFALRTRAWSLLRSVGQLDEALKHADALTADFPGKVSAWLDYATTSLN